MFCNIFFRFFCKNEMDEFGRKTNTTKSRNLGIVFVMECKRLKVYYYTCIFPPNFIHIHSYKKTHQKKITLISKNIHIVIVFILILFIYIVVISYLYI